jgi:hypothetical protein
VLVSIFSTLGNVCYECCTSVLGKLNPSADFTYALSLARGTFFFSIDPAALDQTICSGDNMKHDKDVKSLVSSLASILAFDSP